MSVTSSALFALRPRVGDRWEIKRKGRKIIKEVGSIKRTSYRKGEYPDTIHVIIPTVYWRRAPKGRYTSIRVKWLIKNGRRISTKIESDAAFEKRMAAHERANTSRNGASSRPFGDTGSASTGGAQ